MFSSLFDYLFESDPKPGTLDQREVNALADDASPSVLEWAQQNTSIGDMQAIRLFRRETGASLSVALRVIKELKWRANFASHKEQISLKWHE